MSTSLATEFAPPLDIVERYFIAAIAMLALFFVAVITDPSILTGASVSFKTAAATHLLTLGFVSMTMIGALHQMTPVILEVRIYSYKLARFQFWVYIIGVIGLITSFWIGDIKLLMIFVGVVTLGVILFALNIGIGLLKVKKWSISGVFIASGVLYFVIAAILANFVAASLSHGSSIGFSTLLLWHIAVAMNGWIFFIILGATLELFPMFLLSRKYSVVYSKIVMILLSILIWLPVVSEFAKFNVPMQIYLLLFIASIILIVYQVIIIYGKRMRRKLDIPLSEARISFLFLLLSVAAKLIGLSWQLSGFLFFAGFCGTLILSQLYKVFPFLVWFHAYGSLIGKEKVPLLSEMLSHTLLQYQEISWYIALSLVSVGLALKIAPLMIIGSVIAIFSLSVFSMNFAKVHKHLSRKSFFHKSLH